MKGVNRKRLATLSLMMAMFFLPLGYDVAFFMLQKLVDSYVITTLFFYLVSALFFGLYFLFSGVKPKNFIKDAISRIINKIRDIFSR
jgi:uncharacterized membrane protein